MSDDYTKARDWAAEVAATKYSPELADDVRADVREVIDACVLPLLAAARADEREAAAAFLESEAARAESLVAMLTEGKGTDLLMGSIATLRASADRIRARGGEAGDGGGREER